MLTYIAHEHAGLDWDPKEVIKFDRLWNQGASYKEMARTLKRPQMDVTLLILDRAEKGYIKQRYGGIFGNEWTSQLITKSS